MESISAARHAHRLGDNFGRRVGSVIGWSVAVLIGITLWLAFYLIVR